MRAKFLFLIVIIFSFCSFAQLNVVDANGKKQGVWKKYYPNTKILDYEGTFKNDIPVGEFIYYFKNGKIKAKMNFKNNGTISYSTVYHEDEANLPMASGKYINQKKDSVWNYWGPSGRISMTETYSGGVLNGKKVIYYVPEIEGDTSIVIAQNLYFKDGLKEGEQKEFFDNGVLKYKAIYVKDKIVGEVITYAPSGIIALKDNYVNGEKEGWCYAYDENGLELNKIYYHSGIRLDEKQTKAYLDKLKKQK